MPSESAPNLVDILAQATIAHQEGDLSRASRLYLEVLESEPNNLDALHRVGLLFLGQGQFEEAYQFLTQAVAGNPENATFLNHLGLALLNRGETEGAIDHFQKSIALNTASLRMILFPVTLNFKLGRTKFSSSESPKLKLIFES